MTWAEDTVPNLVRPLINVHFANLHAAEAAFEKVVRRDFNQFWLGMKGQDMPGGDNYQIIH